MSSIFTDGVTPLNKTTMDQLEVAARKGAANGYASLDSGGKIPSAQLPSGVFVPLSSVAAASGVASLDAGTKVPVAQIPVLTTGLIPDLSATYQAKSEKAVANGYASLDSGGKVPAGQLSIAALTFATSLPGSPTNGQQTIYTDSTSAPTYSWLLQYNSTFAKWVFLGGTWREGTTTITVPLAGEYYVEIGGAAQQFPASSNAGLQIAAGGITLTARQGAGGGGTEDVLASSFDKGRMTGLTASQVLTPTVLGSATLRQYIRIQPVYVS